MTQPSTNIFTLRWGKQTFERRQTSSHAFFYTKEGDTFFVNKGLKKVGRTVKDFASSDQYEDHGAWFTETIAGENDKLILLKVQDSHHGSPRAQAGVFLMVHEQAPMLKIAATLCAHRLAVFDTLEVFVGRAYIMSPEEVRARGYKVRPSFVEAFFDQEEIDELLDVEEIMQGSVSKPELVETTDSKGNEVKVFIEQQPKRKLRLRKR